MEAGVDTIFGYPGGAVLPIYDAIYRSDAPFRHVLTRHEQGAIFAAEGYARVTGKTGVVIATSGPGATNLITGITDAMMDSIPLVVFTGQVAKPVVIDIPKNIAEGLPEGKFNDDFHLPGYQPTTKPNPLQIIKLAEALSKAKKPVVLAGAGVLFAKATAELREFVERYQLPVVNTLLGLGSFPGSSPLSLGMGGMHGSYTANMALYECNFLINIGARFDDRLTGNLNHFAKYAKVAHIDIDPAEIGKNVETEIPVVADAKKALQALLAREIKQPDHGEWLETLADNIRSGMSITKKRFRRNGSLKKSMSIRMVKRSLQQTSGNIKCGLHNIIGKMNRINGYHQVA